MTFSQITAPLLGMATLAAFALSAPAQAITLTTPLVPDSGWTSFNFDSPGLTAAPIYSLTSPLPTTVKITDAYLKGDSFDVYEDGLLVLSTPTVPASRANTTADPAAAYADPTYSHGAFVSPSGTHTISITTRDSPFGGGGAFIRDDTNSSLPVAPEPSALADCAVIALVAGGLMWRARRRA